MTFTYKVKANNYYRSFFWEKIEVKSELDLIERLREVRNKEKALLKEFRQEQEDKSFLNDLDLRVEISQFKLDSSNNFQEMDKDKVEEINYKINSN